MSEITFNIDLRYTESEFEQMLEQMRKELGDAVPTEENISATPTFRRIWDRVYAEMVKIDEENKKNAEAEEMST